MSDPKIIYLGPACQKEGDGREWCEDDVWPQCECGCSSVRYVLESDAQSELAALREELAEARRDRDTEQRACIEAHQRLAAAEQRNAELVELLRLTSQLACERMDLTLELKVKDALKPSESGASEVAKQALRMENQRITPARFKCLACGEYHEGSGNLPCPKMSPMSGVKP